jgi:hypothetical protein
LTTQPNPQTPATGHDAGQRGWRLHAVKPGAGRYRAAACGLRPRHGWSLDLFIDDRCKRGEAALLKIISNGFDKRRFVEAWQAGFEEAERDRASLECK